MIRPVAGIVALVLFAAPAAAQDSDPIELALARAIRARRYGDLVVEVRETGTLLGLAPSEVVPTLFDPRAGLAPHERDALVAGIVLASGTMDVSRQRQLATSLVARVDLIEDWSLVALTVRRADAHGVETIGILVPTADRIVGLLKAYPGSRGDSQIAGYESAVIAIAESADRIAGADARPSEAWSVAMAELLREIARLSAHEQVVRSAVAAARHLLKE